MVLNYWSLFFGDSNPGFSTWHCCYWEWLTAPWVQLAAVYSNKGFDTDICGRMPFYECSCTNSSCFLKTTVRSRQRLCSGHTSARHMATIFSASKHTGEFDCKYVWRFDSFRSFSINFDDDVIWASRMKYMIRHMAWQSQQSSFKDIPWPIPIFRCVCAYTSAFITSAITQINV